ncbi:MAG: DNA-directed RNA polymerase subunit omega [Lachnospiraceae bacterium]
MIHPSYVELMKVVNNDVEIGEEPVVNSRYSIVLATAKRARQIIAGDEPMVEDAEGKKPLSIAVEELNDKKVKIVSEEEFEAQQNEMLLFDEDDDEFEEEDLIGESEFTEE